jgi:hypothetical protein
MRTSVISWYHLNLPNPYERASAAGQNRSASITGVPGELYSDRPKPVLSSRISRAANVAGCGARLTPFHPALCAAMQRLFPVKDFQMLLINYNILRNTG